MSGWTKLFSSIVTSSVWVVDDSTLRVWIAMLATSNAEGVVEGSVPGFANLARVTVDQMRAAVATLSGPDADSRTPDHEGRRIEVIEGGWKVLNYAAYRERGQAKEGSRAPYFRQYRKRKAQQEAQPGDVARNTEARGERREAERREAVVDGGAAAGGVQGGDGHPPPPPAADDGVDHDPDDPLQTKVILRIRELARLGNELDGKTYPLADVLKTVSTTRREGRHLDGLRRASPAWLEETLRVCDRFELRMRAEAADRSRRVS